MEIPDAQIVPLDNRLLMAQTLYHLSLSESDIGADGLYTGSPLAFSFVDAALSIYPQHAAALFQRAKLEDSDIEGALDLLRHAIDLDPNHFGAWEATGNIYEMASMPAITRDCWEYALKIAEQKKDAERRTGVETGALLSNEETAVFQLKLGILCEALGKSDRALFHYKEANRRSDGDIRIPSTLMAPSDAEQDPAVVFLRMAQIFQREGFEEEAHIRFQKAMEIDPSLQRFIG
jgi:tetratricopeptide (TPR) repeat protein